VEAKCQGKTIPIPMTSEFAPYVLLKGGAVGKAAK